MIRSRLKTYLMLLLITFSLNQYPTAVFAEAQSATIALTSGATYKGETILNGIPHGKGVATWGDGSRYEGDVFNGMIHGKGVFYFSNGDVYEGEFEYGLRSGKGKMTFSNNDIYNGAWKADMMHGKGKYTFFAPDPSRPKKNDLYNGEWRYNMMHGKGSYTFANGKTTYGYWVKNSYRGTKLTTTLKNEIGELN